jgi:hypothetical protein
MKLVRTTDSALMGRSPAGLDRSQGVIYIYTPVYDKLTAFQKKFVIEHEKGHYYLNTDSEIQADAYAFENLAGTEFRSLKKSLACLNEILDYSNPTLRPRYQALYERVLEWDAAHGNEWAAGQLNKIRMFNKFNG